MAHHPQKRYPTPWQRKMMWAALSAVFIVLLIGIVGSVIWVAGWLVRYLQPILIPVAIAIILSYLLDPVVTHLAERRTTRTKAIILLFAIAGLALVALIGWIVPTISMQSASFMRELPGYTVRARDQVVDVIERYNHLFTTNGPARAKGVAGGFVDWLLASPAPVPAPSATAAPNESSDEVINPPSPKLSTEERQRVQEWVERQLPNLQKQLPVFSEKIVALIRTSIGGFLGATGFLFSLIMVPIYLFFLLKEAPAIKQRWTEYLPLRASPFKDEVAT
ncbi:MAG TPA: AI-2E family transporter, partial [Chthoniobacterales bacterium]